MKRFEQLLARHSEKKNGTINADLMSVLNAHWKVERLKLELRFAEQEFSHALRGLEHKDYDSVFEGWAKADS